ncbi:hypothetical protein ACET3Z_013174 [Daucus carota]
MMQVSKHERDDLVRTRTKLNQVLHFLKSQGFSEENVLAASGLEGSGCRIPSRDEFGLPPLKEPRDENIAQKVLDELPIRNAGNFSSTGPVESVNAPDLLKDKMKGKIEENAVATQIHVEGACPKVTRQWVRKEQPVQPIHLPSDSISDPPSIFSEEKPVKDQNIDASDTPVVEVEDASDWQQVKRKSGTSGNSDSSKQATVPVAKAPVSSPALEISAPTASAMPIYNALSRTLSKNQRKKARRSGGKTPPFKH